MLGCHIIPQVLSWPFHWNALNKVPHQLYISKSRGCFLDRPPLADQPLTYSFLPFTTRSWLPPISLVPLLFARSSSSFRSLQVGISEETVLVSPSSSSTPLRGSYSISVTCHAYAGGIHFRSSTWHLHLAVSGISISVRPKQNSWSPHPHHTHTCSTSNLPYFKK